MTASPLRDLPAVILAAGDGGRLGRLTRTLPKPLVPIGGRPLVSYTLDALAAVGIREVHVVTGYLEESVRGALMDSSSATSLSFSSNPAFERGASYSLRAARAFCGDRPFLLLMADHLFSPALLDALLDGFLPGGPSLVAADSTDRDAAYVDEATRLCLGTGAFGQPREVRAIGKNLETWDALDAGAFVVQPGAWAAVDEAPEDCELSDIGRALIRRHALFAADVSGAFWYDVDTPDDLAAAEALLASAAGGGGS